VERAITESGILLVKYWLDTSMEEQEKRFKDRMDDPRKIWKLSPMDIESYQRWYDYSRARDAMLDATDKDYAPWYIVPANDKKRARLNCISHFLSLIPYEEIPNEKINLGKRHLKNCYDDHLPPEERRFIPQRY
jgi:polyphosphate kinase 2 (PPK2 family)